MAYDEDLVDRLRELTAAVPGLSEKKMFGGLAFLVHGNMAIAASGQGGLLVRVDPEPARHRPSAHHHHVDAGLPRQLVGLVGVDATADDDLVPWVDRGVGFASSLPPK